MKRFGYQRFGYPLYAAACVAGLTFACAKSEAPSPSPPPPCPELDAGTPVDPVLVAFLGKARAAHHSADILEKAQDIEDATRVLSELVDGSHKIPDRAEAKEVVADTRARLADLKSQLKRFDDASEEIAKGMKLAREPSYYRGHLLEMKGLVAERRAKELSKSGDTEAAKRFEADALEAFEEAMRVQQQVIDEALSDPAPR